MFMRLTLHTESSQLICYANQLTGFYMSATLALMGQTQVQEEEVLGLLPEKKKRHMLLQRRNCYSTKNEVFH